MYEPYRHESAGPATVERAAGVGGELALRRTGEHYEIICNGVFLMDTRDGTSERLLVEAACAALDPPAAVLIGGLGVGFSLARAAAHPAVTHITVVEREPAVVAWHTGHLRRFSAGTLDDPRVCIRVADLAEALREDTRRYDAICLDIDNGPEWTVTDGNAALYEPAGLDLLAARLTPRGALAVWSADAAPRFEDRLRGRFAEVTVHRVPVTRGHPDVIYLARHARGGSGAGVPQVSAEACDPTV